ncbi:DUF421 domain-containing protein [Herbivorax sp. ANBcel31]|uniref:DUF421 domain-containing protein n=1 Tax=Herbivorax sp. ANBcel31 TaxID=3069754 RepID=UPI0027B2E028|nr:DUF421 domain-containing protein [Herbivorax sp. ANBcel31]MDQ2086831.1 DUF421 domain-containing protein [Herbivorax sp. ANBcel31]
MQEWIEILLRASSLLILVLLSARIMGKKNMAKVTPFTFISYIVIAVISALISTKVIESLVFGFIALGIWVMLPIAIEYLSIKSKIVHDIVNGKGTILIKQGKIMEENLIKARFTGEELLRELRSKNAFNLADVEFALMEPNGEINVLMKADKKPVTAYDLGKKVAPKSESQTVILDGTALNGPLKSLGLNQSWLKTQLENMGVSIDNVFVGQVDSSGDLYIDLFDDSTQVPQPRVKEMVYANIEKCHADFMKYALETKDESAKKMYQKNEQKLKDLKEKLEPYLLR